MRLRDLGSEPCALYVRVAGRQQRRTRNGDTFLVLKLADCGGVLPASLFSDHACYETASQVAPGQVVALRASMGSYQGAPQLTVEKLRPLDERDEGRWDETEVFGESLAGVKDLIATRLVMDIETAPLVDVRTLPSTLVEEVTRAAKDKDWPIEKVLALNPLFSRVVSIAVGDADGDHGCVLLAPLDEDRADLAANCPQWLRPLPEAEMLAAFWALAACAEVVITFNGRNFDLPFLRSRSAILGVPVIVDLLSQPPYQHMPHLDLYVVLTGGVWGARPMNLDAVCFAFGIESPKGAMDGSMVAPAFREKRYVEIGRYNLADIAATRALFQKLEATVLRYLG